MKCKICGSTENVTQQDWESFVCESCLAVYHQEQPEGQRSNTANRRIKPSSHTFSNIILFPFRLGWNIAVTALIIAAFVLWFGFIFGSVVGVIIILIFAPNLFLLPVLLAPLYTKMWD